MKHIILILMTPGNESVNLSMDLEMHSISGKVLSTSKLNCSSLAQSSMLTLLYTGGGGTNEFLK